MQAQEELTEKIILTDTSLQDPKYDRLGYAPFAKNLAETFCKISSLNEGLVFALFAPWGSGKTTCLNFFKYYIQEKPENERPIVIRFNPWWYSGQGDLLSQFFRELLAVLGRNEAFKDIVNKVASFGQIISVIPEPTGVAKLAGKILSSVKIQDKSIWELKNEISKGLLEQ